mmetsp:Transcript_1348/g.1945  ORF Transcript_1348/g.1945 Transcript_1348/m.1945 type:complete len:290 (-) Transcript_1348:1003-1872(-)
MTFEGNVECSEAIIRPPEKAPNDAPFHIPHEKCDENYGTLQKSATQIYTKDLLHDSRNTSSQITRDKKALPKLQNRRPVNERILPDSRKHNNGKGGIKYRGPPNPSRLVAHMFVHNMPAHILTLPRTVVTAQTPHTFPPCASSTQTTGPTTSTHASFLQQTTTSTVSGHNRATDDGREGTQPLPSNNRRTNLPPGMRSAQRCQNMSRHSVDPVIICKHVNIRVCIDIVGMHIGTQRRRWEGISSTARFAVQTVPSCGMTRTTTPLFHTESVYERHATRTFTGSQEWVFR